MTHPDDLQRPAAEILHADELDRLALADAHEPRPLGWRLTPRSVLAFLPGDEKRGIEPKFVGSRALIERAMVVLASSRGLMPIGEPGTAKSYLSELLAAAIRQGEAGCRGVGVLPQPRRCVPVCYKPSRNRTWRESATP